ncbi:MAG: hypothetical protein GY859_35965, partial [Desulfobacterales bacterium]|nr:hypothetical protein [Desulfobacterales bacterium]
VHSADFAPALESPITPEIAAMAESLGWNPAAIYDFCRNQIDSEWSWGVKKGASGALRDRRGNSHDSSALLAALLRASGYPVRFISGIMEFFPTLRKVRSLTGIYKSIQIAEFLQKAGIPYRPVVENGLIKNFQIEHIWVATKVPLQRYRGAAAAGGEEKWLPLCGSVKAYGYTYRYGNVAAEALPLDAFQRDYLREVRDLDPMPWLRGEVDDYLALHDPALSYDDLLSGRTLIPERLEILPRGMQFKQIKILNEFTSIPTERFHRIRFLATDANGAVLLDATIPTLTLDARKTEIFYEPERVEDQEIIAAHGGLDNTPKFLISLRPVIRVDGERLAVGVKGLPAGTPFQLAMEFITPNGAERTVDSLITGNLTVLGLAAGKPPAPAPLPDGRKDAAQRLHEACMDYLGQWWEVEEELASLMHVRLIRPTVSAVVGSNVLESTMLNGVAHQTRWKGVSFDLDLKTIEGVSVARFKNFEDPMRVYMKTSSMFGSMLESEILEKHFGISAVSTASLFARANQAG